jgi:MFS family permease
MWSFSFFMGNFLGPTLSGIFVEMYGFRETTLFFFSVYIATVFVDVVELSYNVVNSKRIAKSEYEILK